MMTMSTPPFIPTGPMPSFLKIVLTDDERADGELRGAYASRVSVSASRRNKLPSTPDPARAPHHEDPPGCPQDAELLPDASAAESPSPRDATTSTRDAYAPRSSGAAD
jgi:hypothetical protein